MKKVLIMTIMGLFGQAYANTAANQDTLPLMKIQKPLKFKSHKFNGSKAAEYVPGEILVKFVNEENLHKFVDRKNEHQLIFSRSFSTAAGYVHVFKDQGPAAKNAQAFFEKVRSLNDDSLVVVAEPNFIYRIQGFKVKDVNLKQDQANGKQDASAFSQVPTDPMFNRLWGLRNTGNNEPTALLGVAGADIDALKAWDITKGDKRVKIAVIDTGIDYTHKDLKGNLWVNEAELKGATGVDDDKNGYIDDIHGYDFANNDADPMDGHGHGTHCAGTIGAVHNNGEGVAGVMAEVTMVPVKFLTDAGSGTTEGAILAIDYATSLGVDVMSNSWGGGGFSQLLKDAIDRSKEKGIYFIAAAGNSAQNNDERANYPSNYEVENILGVAAHTIDDSMAAFSSYGPRTVHVSAPGKNVLSTVKGQGYAVFSGTSMATPHVSGVVGLLLSEEAHLGFSEFKERLVKTSIPVRSMKRRTLSQGRINAFNVLTNTRPVTNEPDPSAWRRVRADAAFESAHPYADGQSLKKVFRVPNAKYVRVVISKFELEKQYDFLTFRSPATGQVVEQVSGAGENYTSEYVEGDSVEVTFTSDYSVSHWGFKIEALEFVPNTTALE